MRRRGDSLTRVRVIIHLEQCPEHFKIHPDLGALSFAHFLLPLFSLIGRRISGNILGIKEETRIGVIQAVWNYIKLQDLQDKVDRRTVRPDAALRPVRPYF